MDSMERRLVSSVAKKRKKPAEDDPDWKWYKQGNRKASAAHAAEHPAPNKYKVVPRPGGLVKAKRIK